LSQQEIFLPERPLTVGYYKGGAKITINGVSRTFKELPALHHEGGRECTVDYAPVADANDGLLPAPAKIVVRRADTKIILRKAFISNCVYQRMTADEIARAAQEFSQLDTTDTTIAALLAKYSSGNSSDLDEADVSTLEELRDRLTEGATLSEIPGKRLKRIHRLMEIDLVLDDANDLSERFEQYLAILHKHELDLLALTGGYRVIDSAVRCNRLEALDSLLRQWLKVVTPGKMPANPTNESDLLLQCGQYSKTAALIEKSQASHDWGRARFAGQAAGCLLLRAADEYQEKNRGTAQARSGTPTFVTGTTTTGLRKSLSEAKETFAKLDEPMARDKALKAQLDSIERELGQSK
jgi:hypothetical protein